MQSLRTLRVLALSLGLLALPAFRATAQTPPTPGPARAINLVFIGDSITQSGRLDHPAEEAPPTMCTRYLQEKVPDLACFFSNQGHGGFTTKNFLPGSGTFNDVLAAAKHLHAAHPGVLVFSLMLGTNDSANSGPLGAPASTDTYRQNIEAIVGALLAAFPDSIVVLHHPTWHSPNTHTSNSDYEGEATARLKSYGPVLDALAGGKAPPFADHVFVGDTRAYAYFSENSRTELRPENGKNGIYYLHPNLVGAISLGHFWADAIAPVLKHQP